MKRVSVKEFRSNMVKWLKLTPLVLTKNGKDIYSVDQIGDTKSVHNFEKSVHNSVELPKLAKKSVHFGEYGCGCKKDADKLFCSKHGRM